MLDLCEGLLTSKVKSCLETRGERGLLCSLADSVPPVSCFLSMRCIFTPSHASIPPPPQTLPLHPILWASPALTLPLPGLQGETVGSYNPPTPSPLNPSQG